MKTVTRQYWEEGDLVYAPASEKVRVVPLFYVGLDISKTNLTIPTQDQLIGYRVELAKEKYPEGTVFYCVDDNRTFTSNGRFCQGTSVIFNNTGGKLYDSKTDKWAEIKKPKTILDEVKSYKWDYGAKIGIDHLRRSKEPRITEELVINIKINK